MTNIIVKDLGLQPYLETWQAMKTFTAERQAETPDELWLLSHPPTFTQGLNGQAEHLHRNPQNIPVVQTDRGGQITYHAPGQLILYPLIDLKRRQMGVRQLVTLMEQSLIATLADLDIPAEARQDAPGVYVNGQKIASLGLKISRQRSYHGLALNVEMDLTPFQWITPCGLQNMTMTQVIDHHHPIDQTALAKRLIQHLLQQLHNASSKEIS